MSRRALTIFDQTAYAAGRAQAYHSIGWHLAMLGNDTEALAACANGRKLSIEAANKHIEASTLDSIGYILRRRGDHAEALAHYTASLSVRRAAGHHLHQARELTEIGETHLTLGDIAAARDAWEQALLILDELRHRDATDLRARLRRLPPA